MFRSISWRLQFSYGLLLLIALVGLGIFGYLHRKSEMLREVDSTLLNRSRRISSMIFQLNLDEEPATADTAPELPRRARRVDGGERLDVYYRVWRFIDGSPRLIYQSADAPASVGTVPKLDDIPRSGIAMQHGSIRERMVRVKPNHVIVVGQDIASQKARMNGFLLKLICGEAAFAAIFILAGYYLTRRALSPINQISETARTIADGTLDERIPIEGGSSELEKLSEVLNESFDQLERSLLRQQQFTANASHELRTPIAAILSEAQSKPKSIDDYSRSLDNCVGSARSMQALVNQLLELARFDSKDVELDREFVDLDILIGQVVKRIKPMAAEKSITIDSDLEMVQAAVNPVGITQVVDNLLSNAIAYSGANEDVKVRLTEDSERILIEVEDYGIGISAEDLPNIFNRFYRADKSRSDHEKNHFGLGLAISKQIVAAHGGELLAKSDVGKGSIFRVKLPKTA